MHTHTHSLRPGPAQARLLAGQKLQGVLTSQEVQAILRQRGWEADYPLFTTGARPAQRSVGPGARMLLRSGGRLRDGHPGSAC